MYQQHVVAGQTYRLRIDQRPNNQRAALDAIVDEFWPKHPDVSEKEALLYLHAGGNANAAKYLLAHNWLKPNEAAVCHKLAISVFMGHLVDWVQNLFDQVIFGAPPTGDTEMTELIRQMTTAGHPARGWFQSLVGYRTPPVGVSPNLAYAQSISFPVDVLCDSLVRELNRSPANLYIGHAPSNSSIQEDFDPHVPIDPVSLADVMATPRSRQIYDAEHALATRYGKQPSSPARDADAYATSSINAAPGHLGFNQPPLTPGGSGYYKL